MTRRRVTLLLDVGAAVGVGALAGCGGAAPADRIAGSSSGFALQAYVPAGGTRLFISTDGLSWRLVDPGQFGEDSVGDVAGYGGGWLAVGSGPSRNGNSIPPDLPGSAWW